MKLAVSYNAEGDILVMFDPEKLRNEKVKFQYVPAPGERHHIIELPKELEKEALFDLPKMLRVKVKGKTPKFERK